MSSLFHIHTMRTTLKQRLTNAVIQNSNGFTADKNGNVKTLRRGYAVSITNNKNKEINELVNLVIAISKSQTKPKKFYFGGWTDRRNKEFYLDITLVEQSKATAVKLARQHKQQAIFSFRTYEEILIK